MNVLVIRKPLSAENGVTLRSEWRQTQPLPQSQTGMKKRDQSAHNSPCLYTVSGMKHKHWHVGKQQSLSIKILYQEGILFEI